MSAVTGIVLFAFAVFIFGVALIMARKPNPPAWLTEGSAGSLITITTIAFAVTGLGLVGQFAASYGREPLGAKEIVLISISVMLLIVILTGIVKALRRSATTGVPQGSAVGNAPSALVESPVTALEQGGPSMPVKHDPSRSGGRKRPAPKRAA
jgi:hypothetical protein